jgi:carbonic anhydrase/acetyltransferase-like protein (isoleucine patch superfamily)
MENQTYIAPNATVVGDVTLGKDVNIWWVPVRYSPERPTRLPDLCCWEALPRW